MSITATDFDYYAACRERARRGVIYGHACDRSRVALNRYNAERTEANRAALMKSIEDCDRKWADVQAVKLEVPQ
jgi:hypothetical protein